MNDAMQPGHAVTGNQLFDLPHCEARRRLESGEVVWMCVDPVEYHGPHLPLHTDRLLSAALVCDLHRAMGGTEPPLVAANLEVGVDPTPGPGTRHHGFSDVRRAVRRAVTSLRDLGATRIVIATFHGAPLHNRAIYDGVLWGQRLGMRAVAPFQQLTRELGGITLPTHDPDGVRATIPVSALEGLDLDFHAGFLETSLMLHWAADAVSPIYRELPPCPALPPLRSLGALGRLVSALGARRMGAEMLFASKAAGWNDLRPFPGYTGAPALATAAIGRWFAGAIVDGLAPFVAEVLDARTVHPPPPFAWVGPLTLWGRLSPPKPSPREVWLPS